MFPLVHKNTNVPLILKCCDVIFVYAGKSHNCIVLGVLRGGLDFFDPKMATRYARDHLGVKKVSPPPHNPLNYTIM